MLRGIDPKLPAGTLDSAHPHGFAWLMLLTTIFTTVSWMLVTFFTMPEPREKLQSFYDLVKPATPGWRPFAANDPNPSKQSLAWTTLDWIAGCGLIYCTLFGVGRVIFGQYGQALPLLGLGVFCAWFIYWDLNRRGWETFSS